jgi:hypothetical protein
MQKVNLHNGRLALIKRSNFIVYPHINLNWVPFPLVENIVRKWLRIKRRLSQHHPDGTRPPVPRSASFGLICGLLKVEKNDLPVF